MNKFLLISVLYLTFLVESCATKTPTQADTPVSSQTPTTISTTDTFTNLPNTFPLSTPTEKTFATYPLHFNLPDWVSNSQTMILAVPITERKDGEITSRNIEFLNASTGEQSDIPIPSNARAYFWYDNMHLGFLSDNLHIMYLINLSNGQVIQKNTTDQTTRLLSKEGTFVPLVIRQDPLSISNIIFDYAHTYWGSPYSIDTRYLAESDRSINENPITVTDSETGQIIWKSNPSDGYRDVHFLWSPVRNSYLAIIAGKLSDTGFGFPIKDTALMLSSRS